MLNYQFKLTEKEYSHIYIQWLVYLKYHKPVKIDKLKLHWKRKTMLIYC